MTAHQHQPVASSDTQIVDGKKLVLWVCATCGEMLGWRPA